VRRSSAILRQFGKLVQGGRWTPHAPVTEPDNLVFASQFEDEEFSLWLLVNRDPGTPGGGRPPVSTTLRLPCPASSPASSFYDVYQGVRLEEAECGEDGVSVNTTVVVEGGGMGAVLLTQQPLSQQLQEFLAVMAEMTARPLADFSPDWEPLQQTLQPQPPVNQVGESREKLLVDGGSFSFSVKGNCIEGDRLPDAVDVQFPWEDHPQRAHQHILEMAPLYADRYPVTNAEYAAFLAQSGWQPSNPHNWLRHWENGSVPAGWERRPVVWVSHGDAAEFCGHYGDRLPESWEWQWAAQGPTGWAWPWGDEEDPTRLPAFTSGRELPAPDSVDSHPAGASWAGLQDLVGNVYQWTSVFTDLHTSRAVLRGGPHWRPEGSHWYQPYPGLLEDDVWSAGPLYEHNTYLLMADSLDRSGQIGFRCVRDTAP